MKTLVLNDFRSISLAFKKEEFLGRPENIAFNVLINLQGKSLFLFPLKDEQHSVCDESAFAL